MLENLFKLKQHNTDVRKEILAGVTTFMTMAYIIFVNPDILSAAGMDFGAVTTATILTAAFASIFMGLFVNYPFALASGMGLNAFFAFTVAGQAGWQAALGAVFISGVVFFILSVGGIVKLIDDAVPQSLKHSVAVGIGLFIALIGFKNAGIVVEDPATLVTLGKLDSFSSEPVLALIGLGLIAVLMALKVKGAILIGILATTVVGIFMDITQWQGIFGAPHSLGPVLFELDLRGALSLGFFTIFAFVFVDIFDTMGTLLGTAAKAGYLDEKGRLPRVGDAMIVDAVATAGGAILGTSTVTTYVESTAGIAEGGRTGLTSVTVGVLFLLTLFIAPLALSVPSAATAPALIIVGVIMMEAISKVNFGDFTEAFPAFLTIAVMPFTFSIADGIAAGFIAYPLVKVFAGKASQVHVFVYLLAIASLIHFFL